MTCEPITGAIGTVAAVYASYKAGQKTYQLTAEASKLTVKGTQRLLETAWQNRSEIAAVSRSGVRSSGSIVQAMGKAVISLAKRIDQERCKYRNKYEYTTFGDIDVVLERLKVPVEWCRKVDPLAGFKAEIQLKQLEKCIRDLKRIFHRKQQQEFDEVVQQLLQDALHLEEQLLVYLEAYKEEL